MLKRGFALLLLGCAILTAAPVHVRAGACPSPQLRVLPGESTVAPTNVRVVLNFEDEWVSVYELVDERTRQIRKTGFVQASAVDVQLRAPSGRAVPLTLRRPPAAHRPLIIAVPRQPLRPRSRYAVVVRAASEEYVVAHVTTGAGPDTDAPDIGQVERAEYFVHGATRHWKDPSGSYANVTLSGATDVVAYEIHATDGGDAPTDATLRAIVEYAPAVVRISGEGPCHDARFTFPRVPRDARSHRLHLGLRAIDLAGNASPLRPFSLELAQPQRQN